MRDENPPLSDRWPGYVIICLYLIELLLLMFVAMGVYQWVACMAVVVGSMLIGKHLEKTGMSDQMAMWLRRRRSERRRQRGY